MQKYYENPEIRQEVDVYLKNINNNRAKYLGTDSTQKDLDTLKLLNEPLKDRIRQVDPEFYKETFL